MFFFNKCFDDCFLLLCSPCERSVNGDEESKKLVPCMQQQYVDLKYFPNAPDPDGNLRKKVCGSEKLCSVSLSLQPHL